MEKVLKFPTNCRDVVLQVCGENNIQWDQIDDFSINSGMLAYAPSEKEFATTKTILQQRGIHLEIKDQEICGYLQ